MPMKWEKWTIRFGLACSGAAIPLNISIHRWNGVLLDLGFILVLGFCEHLRMKREG